MSVSENFVRNSCLSVSREGDSIRLVWSLSCKKKGFENVASDLVKKSSSIDSVRLNESICRTRSLVRQYCLCNDWDYFCTFTISPDKWDRFDLKTFYKSFSKYINNINNRRNDDGKLLYLLIPEQHKNGAWHFHGLMTGIPSHFLVINENGFLDWPLLKTRFGFCSLSPVRDHIAVAYYITKYISKDMFVTPLPSHSRILLCSHGLKRATSLLRLYGFPKNCGIDWQYSDSDGFFYVYTIKNADKDAEAKLLSSLYNIYCEEVAQNEM